MSQHYNSGPSGQESRGEMELCQITGRLVPKDEIVEFQGYRVCAEGKQEILRRLRAGQAMPGELETPGIGARFLALVIDSIILGMVNILGMAILAAGVIGSSPDISRYNLEGADKTALFFRVLSLLLVFAYFTVFHAAKGQTPGKMAAKLIVVDYQGNRLSYSKAFLRAFCYQGINVLLYLPQFFMEPSEESYIVIFGAIAVVVGLWAMTDIILALVDRAEQKSLHDRLARTRVIVKP